jgi:hypothetical protein
MSDTVKESEDFETIWRTLTENRDEHFLGRCQAVWEIPPAEVVSLTYKMFIEKASEKDKVTTSDGNFDSSSAEAAVALASDTATNSNRDEEQQFAATCSLLARTLLRHGCFVEELSAHLSHGRPRLRTLVLIWMVCVVVAGMLSVASVLHLPSFAAVLCSVLAWTAVSFFAWHFFVRCQCAMKLRT